MIRIIACVGMALAGAMALASEFTPGTGASFDLRLKDSSPVRLDIYISNSSFGKLGVEYHFFKASAFSPVEMWQQFQMEKPAEGPLVITKGHVKTATAPAPRAMTASELKQKNGVQVHDFLFSNQAELSKHYVAKEKITVSAGIVMAAHYRITRGPQVIHFWIAEEAKPIGLIKLESTGLEKHHNYSLELTNLLKNVKPAITPQRGVASSQ